MVTEGMALAGGTGEIADSAGGAAAARMAVAQSVTIGGTELRDVSMLAFPDDRPPWNELEPGHRGIVGLPLALALDNIRWTSSGTCETGPRRDRARASENNLAISGATPVVRIFYEGRPLSFMLDTGNVRETQLWPRSGLAGHSDMATTIRYIHPEYDTTRQRCKRARQIQFLVV